jgi:hypothetical protein
MMMARRAGWDAGQRLEEHDAFGEIGHRLEAARGDTLRAGLRKHQIIAPPLGRSQTSPAPTDLQRRRGHIGGIVPAWLQRACLEAERPGHQQNVADPDRAVGGEPWA